LLTQKRAADLFLGLPAPYSCQANEIALATNSESLDRYSRPAVTSARLPFVVPYEKSTASQEAARFRQ
jgi:hypothetical protein